MRAQVVVVSIALGEQRVARGMAALAPKCCAHLPDAHAVPVLLAVAVTHAVNGEVEPARALLERCAPHLPGCDPLSIDQPLVLAALTYASLGDVAAGRGWLETSVRRTEAAQAVGLLPFQLSWLTLLCWFDGDWVAALAHGHARRRARRGDRVGHRAAELPGRAGHGRGRARSGGRGHGRTSPGPPAWGPSSPGAGCIAAHASRVTGLIELGAGTAGRSAAALGEAAEFALACRMSATRCSSWAREPDRGTGPVRPRRRGAGGRTGR